MNVGTFTVFIVGFLIKHSGALREIRQILEVMPDKPTGTIMFLHCGGDTGPAFKKWIDFVGGAAELFTDMHLIFPTAPEMVYSPFGEKMITAWYNEDKASPAGTIEIRLLDDLAHDLMEIIKNETQYKIPMRNIFVGGFGMGGTIAMHLAYRFLPDLGGCFIIAAYLKSFSRVYRVLKFRRKNRMKYNYPPFFMAQGENDHVIDPKWSAKTCVKLRRFGIEGSFYSVPQAFHEVTQSELIELDKWILTRMKTPRVKKEEKVKKKKKKKKEKGKKKKIKLKKKNKS